MPRLLVAAILALMLVVYYFYKTSTNEKTEEIKQKTTIKQVKVIEQIKEVKDVEKTENAEEKIVQEVKEIKQEVTLKKVVKPTQKSKPVSQKKKDYYAMMVPALNEVYAKLQKQYEDIKILMQTNPTHTKIESLKKKYKVNSNKELLIALKPHPKSIAIAQGAMESAWGTSRFYKVAYNIFGVWSFNKNDKRVAAGETRGTKIIWLKKYDNAKESIEDYYLTMSRSKAFKAFKKLNYETTEQNPYLLVKKLDRYSEKGALYGEELASMISYNNFTSYDAVQYKKPSKKLAVTKPASITDENERIKLLKVVDSIQDNEDSYSNILKGNKDEKSPITKQ